MKEKTKRRFASNTEPLTSGARLLPRKLIRFTIVGSAAFAMDAAILAALVHLAGWDPFGARIVAISAAGVCTWWLHRNWTFATGRTRAALPQSLMHGGTQLIGFAVNYLIFSLLLVSDSTFHAYPVLAVVVGSLFAMYVSYGLSKKIVFGQSKRTAAAATGF